MERAYVLREEIRMPQVAWWKNRGISDAFISNMIFLFTLSGSSSEFYSARFTYVRFIHKRRTVFVIDSLFFLHSITCLSYLSSTTPQLLWMMLFADQWVGVYFVKARQKSCVKKRLAKDVYRYTLYLYKKHWHVHTYCNKLKVPLYSLSSRMLTFESDYIEAVYKDWFHKLVTIFDWLQPSIARS